MTQVTPLAAYVVALILRSGPLYLLEATVWLLVRVLACLMLPRCTGMPIGTARTETTVLQTPTTQPETISVSACGFLDRARAMGFIARHICSTTRVRW